MDKFTTIMLRIAQAMTGGIALYSFCMLLLHNEPFEIFKFDITNGKVIEVRQQKHNICFVTYKYQVNGEPVVTSARIINSLLYEKEGNVVNFRIAYNKIFPSINRINDFTLYNGYYVGLVWGLLMFSIFVLMDLIADKKKWAERYKRTFRAL